MAASLPARTAAFPALLIDEATPARRWQRPKLGVATSTTRASSSPPTSGRQSDRRLSLVEESARKSLFGRQQQDLEEFDIALCDGELGVEQSLEKSGSVGDMVIPASASSSRSTCASLHLSATVAQGPDAWSVDDWSSPDLLSPASSGCVTSPCSAARTLDETQRHIVNAVHAELQIDLSSCMEKVVSQMSLRISDEIGSVRKHLEEDIQKVLDDMLSIQKGQETAGHKSGEELAAKDLKTSSQVMEARAVADQRHRRMMLDGIETTLDNHLESIDTLGKQLSTFNCRFVTHDVDIRHNAQAIQRVEARLQASSEKDRLELRENFETHLQMIESLRTRCSTLETRIPSGDTGHRSDTRVSTTDSQRLAPESTVEIDKLKDQFSDLVKKVHEFASNIEKSQSDAQSSANDQIQDIVKAIQAQVCASEQMESQILSNEEGSAASAANLQRELDELRAGVEGKMDAKVFSGAMVLWEDVAREHMEMSVATEKGLQMHAAELKSLAEKISDKSGSDDMVRLELKAWVEGACQTTQQTLCQMFEMYEQVRCSTESQNVILTRHEQWIKDMQQLTKDLHDDE